MQTALLVCRIVENNCQLPGSSGTTSGVDCRTGTNGNGRLNLSTRTSNRDNKKSSIHNSTSGRTLSSWGSTGNLNAHYPSSINLSGNSCFLSSFMERLVGVLSQFLTDGNQETR